MALYGQENTIKIDVDNSCQPNSRWYTGSGIYRDVNLFDWNRTVCAKRWDADYHLICAG